TVEHQDQPRPPDPHPGAGAGGQFIQAMIEQQVQWTEADPPGPGSCLRVDAQDTETRGGYPEDLHASPGAGDEGGGLSIDPGQVRGPGGPALQVVVPLPGEIRCRRTRGGHCHHTHRGSSLDRLTVCRSHSQAPVDHRAQSTSSGWKNRRINRARSVSRPNPSVPSTYWAIFPGKMRMKNAARAVPPRGRNDRGARMGAAPSGISTPPEATTTRSGSSGIQLGTWAWNSSRRVVRWPVPAPASATPSAIRARVRDQR